MHPELEALRALGLTEYGARAYRALVALGPSGAETVASAASVPRTKVYAVLADLAKRGWVESEGGRPRLYKARRPAECFARERERLGAQLDAALPGLEAQYRDRSTRFAGPLWILQGPEALAQRSAEMVQAAKTEVVLVASFPLPGDEKALPKAIRDARRRGVRVRLAVPDASLPHARALAVPGVEVRTVTVPPRILVVDGRQGLVSVPIRRPDGSLDVKGIWNPSPELLEMMGGAVLGIWEQAHEGAETPAPQAAARSR